MSRLFFTQVNRASDLTGAAISGAWAFFYENKTTTQVTVYVDATVETPLARPVLGRPDGTFPAVYIPDPGLIRINVADANGVWKTDYNLLGRIRADHPHIGGTLLRMRSAAIDPQDANVGAVTFEIPSYSVCYRSTNIQSNSPSWEDVTYNAPRLNGGVLA